MKEMIHGYVFDKLCLAVRWLAIAQGSIQDRVCNAYLFHLRHVQKTVLPEELHGVFKEIEQKLTQGSPISGKEESVRITTSAMSADHASLIADKMVYLFHQAAQRYYTEGSKI